ncbi:hypothetical protein SK128_002915, partial [Halocaridina rubra]
MILAQNSYFMSGTHSGYRSYDSDEGIGPPVGDRVPLQPGNTRIPSFSLPPSGVPPYTGPFPPPQPEIQGNTRYGMEPMSANSQNAVDHGNRDTLGNISRGTSESYPTGMGYHHHLPQQRHPHLNSSHDQYLGSSCHEYQGHQYSPYGTPVEANLRHQPCSSTALPPIYEDCTESANTQYGSYVHQHVPHTYMRSEVEHHQVVPTKTEPDWWHDDGDVLSRIRQISLHSDHSPSRERTTPRRKR